MNITQKEVLEIANTLLGDKIISIESIGGGNVNTTFMLNGISSNYFLRIFENNTWPEPGKLTWINKNLNAMDIPHADQILYDGSDKYFPFGFEITRYIDGVDMQKMLDSAQITYEDYYKMLGKFLSSVHAIKGNSYGLVEEGSGTGAEFLDVVWEVYKNFDLEVCKEYFPQDFKKTALKLTESLLHDHLENFEPVLVHYDANPQNCIYTSTKQLVLVDWDNALFLPLEMDFAAVTYWQNPNGHMKKIFFDSYNKNDISYNKYLKMERAFHIFYAVNLIPYAFDHDKKLLQSTMDKILKLVTT